MRALRGDDLLRASARGRARIAEDVLRLHPLRHSLSRPRGRRRPLPDGAESDPEGGGLLRCRGALGILLHPRSPGLRLTERDARQVGGGVSEPRRADRSDPRGRSRRARRQSALSPGGGRRGGPALLRAAGAAYLDCLLAPVDRCYELVGLVRQRYRGFDGDEGREAIEAFFRGLEARAQPVERGLS